MSEEILINVAPMETRVALLENGVLQDVYIERTRSRGIVGNIYKGKVIRVLPGMQAAFIDIGSGKAAFLHINDIWLPQLSGTVDQLQEKRPPQDNIDIRTVLHEGQSLVVQVIKDPIASKGARLTTCLSISSRFVVYVPHNPHIGISQKIEDEAVRERLRLLVAQVAQQAQIGSEGGFIVRTVAETVSEAELLADIQLLKRLWESLEQRIPGMPVPGNLYEDLPLFMRTMRDLVHVGIERVRIDSLSEYHKMRNFADLYEPRLHDLLEFWSSERPIFDLYGVDDEIEKALGRRVDLKSGGYLIIDQTEAMTTVDVNTGAFVGSRNLEETIYKTNLEAAQAIARQLRLRNLGGIIILDFIDMQEIEHQRQVLRVFEKAIERDRAKITVSDVSPLGLVEMTRKRTRESIGRQLCEPCPTCYGCGTVKSAETVCNEIFREIMREARTYENAVLLVLASPAVIDRLLDEDSATVADIEELTGKTITFRVEAIYTREQYDIIPA